MWKLLCFPNADPAFSPPPWTRCLSECASLANLCLKPAPPCFCMYVPMSSARKRANSDDFQAWCAHSMSLWLPCVREERRRKKKVICYNRQALLLLACCGLDGFRNFLWQIWSPVRISAALLDTRTGMESFESVKFTSSSQTEERPFFPQLPGQTLDYTFTTAFILEKWATKLEFIISMIAVDHWGATLKFEKWDWFNLMITWILWFMADVTC